MPNPAANVPTTIPVQLQEGVHHVDGKDSVALIRLLKDRTPILAKITALSAHNRGDEFVADLYADGRVSLSAPESMYKTHTAVLIYNPDIYSTHVVGDLVYVSLNPDMTGLMFPATFKVSYAKLSAAWTPLSPTITATPCASDGTVTGTPADVTIQIDGITPHSRSVLTISLPAQFDAPVGTVLTYATFDGVNYLISPPAPTALSTVSTYQVYQWSSTGGAIFDYIRVAP